MTADDYRRFSQRIQVRTLAIRNLADQSVREMIEAEVRAKEAAGGAKGELLDARVARVFADEDFDGMLRYEPTHRHDLRTAETRAIRAREKVAALENPAAKADAGVTARGADGADLRLTDRQCEQLDSFAADVLATSRTEVKTGPPAADRWAAALQGGHVRIRYRVARAFRDPTHTPGVKVEEFVVRLDDATVVTRDGATYRAFADARGEWVDRLRAVARGEP